MRVKVEWHKDGEDVELPEVVTIPDDEYNEMKMESTQELDYSIAMDVAAGILDELDSGEREQATMGLTEDRVADWLTEHYDWLVEDMQFLPD